MKEKPLYFFKKDKFTLYAEGSFLIFLLISSIYVLREYNILYTVTAAIIGIILIYFFLSIKIKEVSVFSDSITVNYPYKISNRILKTALNEITEVNYILSGLDTRSMTEIKHKKGKIIIKGGFREFKNMFDFFKSNSIDIYYLDEVTGEKIKYSTEINPDGRTFL